MKDLNLTREDIDTLCEALTHCIDEGDFNEGDLLDHFKSLLPRLEAALIE